MIRSLRVRDWRAYRSLELEFEPGTTFIVAPNGVGKTSLILALAWGLLGDDSGVSGKDCVRAGADDTEVKVKIDLNDDLTLEIVRRCTVSGRAQATFTVGDHQIDEASANKLLEESFGVNPKVAARLAMMPGGGHIAAEKALDLRDHLYTAFGLRHLLDAQASASAIAKTATRARETFRASNKNRVADRRDIEFRTQDLDARIRANDVARPSLMARLNAARDRKEIALAWRAFDARLIERDSAIRNVNDQVRMVLGDSAAEGTTDAESLLRVSAELERHIEQLNMELISAQAREMADNHALELLGQTSAAICPTCLRPIEQSEVETASHEHELGAVQAGARVRELQVTISEARAKLARIQRLERDFSALPDVKSRPDGDRPDEQQIRQDIAGAEDALRIHDTQVGRLEAERDSLLRALSADEERDRSETQMRLLYRREAISKAAAAALDETVQRLITERIDPLVNEIQWRWKQLFGREGLQLRPNGSIVMVTAGRELPWASLSGGERIWARLVTHILVLATSTKISFAWFDEPLEHLDPRARRTVAAALATASKVGGPRQIIVTTYEYAIAQQMAADVPSTSVLRVRAAGQG